MSGFKLDTRQTKARRSSEPMEDDRGSQSTDDERIAKTYFKRALEQLKAIAARDPQAARTIGGAMSKELAGAIAEILTRKR